MGRHAIPITSTPSPTTIARNGPGGFIYMPQSSPDFAVPHILVSEWNVNQVASYELDGDGNPITRTREVFIDGFNGAWGAVLDPSTNEVITDLESTILS
jgi:hypothetical protein